VATHMREKGLTGQLMPQDVSGFSGLVHRRGIESLLDQVKGITE
jgi:hypothetical protein